MEVMEETKDCGDCCLGVLKDFQYLDSGVWCCEEVEEVGLSLGFTG